MEFFKGMKAKRDNEKELARILGVSVRKAKKLIKTDSYDKSKIMVVERVSGVTLAAKILSKTQNIKFVLDCHFTHQLVQWAKGNPVDDYKTDISAPEFSQMRVAVKFLCDSADAASSRQYFSGESSEYIFYHYPDTSPEVLVVKNSKGNIAGIFPLLQDPEPLAEAKNKAPMPPATKVFP